MQTLRCPCGALITAGTQEECDAAFKEHQYSVHDALRPIEEISIKENTNVEPKPELVIEPKPLAAPPAMALIEALIMQLETALAMIKVPDYVESAAKNFVEALRKWSEGGK